MNYKIVEKEGERYLLFEEKEYEIYDQQGKFLRVRDFTKDNNLDMNIFNLETEEFLLKEWVYFCSLGEFGIGICKNQFHFRLNNFFSLEARCEVFREDKI